MVYVLRNLVVEIPLPSYTWLPSLCKKKIEYRLENQSIGTLSTLSYPNFFKLDLVTKKVTLKGESFAESDREFKFRLVATTTDGSVQNNDYVFKIKTLFKNSAPSFK